MACVNPFAIFIAFYLRTRFSVIADPTSFYFIPSSLLYSKKDTINALKMTVMHRKLSMRLKYCRKIYASWLHKSGISESLIDMLQGRIGKNIFLRHYLTPSSSYKTEVLKALEKLQRQL